MVGWQIIKQGETVNLLSILFFIFKLEKWRLLI